MTSNILKNQPALQTIHHTSFTFDPASYSFLLSNNLIYKSLDYTNFNQCQTIAQCVYLLNMVISSKDNNTYLTKREIYYKDVQLFAEQKQVDRLIQMLSITFQIQRIHLNIISESKGLIAGNITFYEGQIYYDLNNFNKQNKTKQISEFTDMITDIQIDADYLLIIEKETVFNHFLFGEYQKYLGKIIIATGKGYPDYSIKKFLKKINFLYPDLIYFYLGDYDPYGIDILMNYTFSSEKQVYEYFSLPNIHYLNLDQQVETFQELNDNDKKKIDNMLNKQVIQKIQGLNQSNDFNINRWQQWIKVLENMKQQNIKYELENLENILVLIQQMIEEGRFI